MATNRGVALLTFGAIVALLGSASPMSHDGGPFEERFLGGDEAAEVALLQPSQQTQAEPQSDTLEARFAAALRGVGVAGLLDRLLEEQTGDISVGTQATIDEAPSAPTLWQALTPAVCKKPLVAIGIIGAPASAGLIDDGGGVYSTRPFLVERVISNLVAPTLRRGLTVTALHFGGTVMIGSRRVIFGVPNGGFEVGARYLLVFNDFLENTDVFVTHPTGFRLDGQSVRSMNHTAFRQSRGLSQAELLAQFNEAVARMPQSCTIVKGK